MCSIALLIAGGTAFVIRGDRNYGVDFKGGDLLSLSAAKTVQVAQVREALKPIHLDNEPIQQSVQGDRNFITIRSPINTSESVAKAIREHIPNGQFKVEREERVGALVGGELAKSSLWALGLGIFGILIYVTIPLRAILCGRRNCRAAPRCSDDGRHFFAARKRTDPDHGRGRSDDRWLFDQRHNRCLRSNSRGSGERAARHRSSKS